MSSGARAQDADLVIRLMRPEELDTMRDLSVAAFDGDPQIRVLLDNLHDSWAWDDELSFVAEVDGEFVGQVLYTHALPDAQNRLVDVLVLSPVGVRPDQQNGGIGSLLIRESLARLAPRNEPLAFLEGCPRYGSASNGLQTLVSKLHQTGSHPMRSWSIAFPRTNHGWVGVSI